MLRLAGASRLARRASLLAAWGGGVACAAQRQVHGAAAGCRVVMEAREDEASSSKGGMEADTFERAADFVLGDVWNRMERALRNAEGEAFEFDVKTEHAGITVSLPSGSWVTISKQPDEHALRVSNTLFPAWANRGEAVFRLTADAPGVPGAPGKWWRWEECAGEEECELYSFLEEGLEQSLKVKVDLKAEPGRQEDAG